MSETMQQAMARLEEWSAAFDVEVSREWEADAERRSDEAAERFWEGADRSDRCAFENQADLALHDSLFPNGYR